MAFCNRYVLQKSLQAVDKVDHFSPFSKLAEVECILHKDFADIRRSIPSWSEEDIESRRCCGHKGRYGGVWIR